MASAGSVANSGAVARAIRTPRAAAVAGIAFALLFAAALTILRTALPADADEASQWLADSSRQDAVWLGLALVPFAGIAFLWFIGVVRDRIGSAEDRFFATAFFGSGVLVVGMLFVASAVAGGLMVAAERNADAIISSGAWEFGRETTHELIVIYGMRMAAVWILSISTILLRTKLGPRWLVISGYAVAVVLLLTSGSFPWVELLFPAWVMVLSLHVLVTSFRRHPAMSPEVHPPE